MAALARVRSRKAREGPTDNAEVFLSEPDLAEGFEYFRLGSLSVTNDWSRISYSTDTNGTERYTMVVKDLQTGEVLPDTIEQTRGGAVWSTDNSFFYYTLLDETGHPFQIRRHVLGTPVEEDALVYEETDPGFFLWVSSTNSDEYVVIGAGDHITREYQLIDASDPAAEPVLVAPRKVGHEYQIDHQGDRFVIRTNDTHQNFRLAIAPEDNPTQEAWETLLQGSDSLYITWFHVTEDYIATDERIDGLDQVRIIDREGNSTHVEFPDAAYTAYNNGDPEFDVNTLRLKYTSMTTPWTDYDYHIDIKGTGTAEGCRRYPAGMTPRSSSPAGNWQRHGTECRCPCPSCATRTRRWTVRRRFTSTPTELTAAALPRTFPRRGCLCWSGDSSSPSPMSGAATSWDSTGTRPENCSSAPTHSTTSLTWPAT